jgi:hypothetical protein
LTAGLGNLLAMEMLPGVKCSRLGLSELPKDREDNNTNVKLTPTLGDFPIK